MFERWHTYLQIDDLQRDAAAANRRSNAREKRGQVPIAVIDDEAFSPEANLRANGYEIRVIGDLRSLDQIEPFNVILCDLQGVGRQLDKKGQGAFIINEIKRNHPEKFVVAYTGGSPDAELTLRAQEDADFFLRKDADIDDWRDRLDDIIAIISDPVEVWKRQRVALIHADVPTLEILQLEDSFVHSIRTGNSSAYQEMATNSSVSGDLRSIAQSLIASGLFKLMGG